MKWLEALKVWNSKRAGKRWEIPRKGTKEYAQVMKLMGKARLRGRGDEDPAEDDESLYPAKSGDPRGYASEGPAEGEIGQKPKRAARRRSRQTEANMEVPMRFLSDEDREIPQREYVRQAALHALEDRTDGEINITILMNRMEDIDVKWRSNPQYFSGEEEAFSEWDYLTNPASSWELREMGVRVPVRDDITQANNDLEQMWWGPPRFRDGDAMGNYQRLKQWGFRMWQQIPRN
jgi:hypothetical protein